MCVYDTSITMRTRTHIHIEETLLSAIILWLIRHTFSFPGSDIKKKQKKNVLAEDFPVDVCWCSLKRFSEDIVGSTSSSEVCLKFTPGEK